MGKYYKKYQLEDWIHISSNDNIDSYYPSEDNINNKYGVIAIPEYFLINPEGVVVKKFRDLNSELDSIEELICTD